MKSKFNKGALIAQIIFNIWQWLSIGTKAYYIPLILWSVAFITWVITFDWED